MTTITYKGETIATVTQETKTMQTAGKYMEDDVTITDTIPSNYGLITWNGSVLTVS